MEAAVGAAKGVKASNKLRRVMKFNSLKAYGRSDIVGLREQVPLANRRAKTKPALARDQSGYAIRAFELSSRTELGSV